MKIAVFVFISLTLMLSSPCVFSQVVNTEEIAPQKKQVKKVRKAVKKESCYQLGYRYGKCFTLGMAGLPCDPKDDIVIPPECRNNPEKDRGLKAGIEEVYRKHGRR